MGKLLASLLLICAFLPQAAAETEAWQPSLWLEAVRVIGALLLIIPLAYLTVRFWGKQNRGARGKIVVLERHQLAPGRILYLVRVGEEVLLLGGAERSLNLLRTYGAEEAAALLPLFAEEEPAQFEKVLEGQIQRLKNMRSVFQKREKGKRD